MWTKNKFGLNSTILSYFSIICNKESIVKLMNKVSVASNKKE